jgi:hypothetical protein
MSYVQVAIAGFNALQQVQVGQKAKRMGAIQGDAADYAAQQEREQALQTAVVIRRAGERQRGQARGALAASGVRVDEGSAALAQDEITRGAESDAFQALLEGGRKARGLETDGQMARISGRQQADAGKINAAGTLMSGVYGAAKANGWRTAGPGFSGLQKPAPVETRTINYIPGR